MLKFMVKEIVRDLGKACPHYDTVLGLRVTSGLGSLPRLRVGGLILFWFLRRFLSGAQ